MSSLLSEQLRGRRCRDFSSDLCIRVLDTGLTTYPDVSVACERLEVDPEDPTGATVTNPRLLVEVLSPSTEDYDRGEQLDHYRHVASLDAVVLVAQDARRVDVWLRQGASWTETSVRDTGEAAVPALGVVLPLEEIDRDPLAGAHGRA